MNDITEFRKDIQQVLTEAEMLDISIQNINKYLTSDAKITKFFETPVKIEHKTDGIKITLIYTGDEKRPFIVAYKGQVQYDGEFDYAAKTSIKQKSIGSSQFQIIFDHLRKIPFSTLKSIKPGLEFFIEYLMKKPTLSSNYERSHGMVLIATSPTKYSEKFGRLVSQPKEFNTSDREKYAKILNIDTPVVLFEGIMGSVRMFESGIKNKELKDLFTKVSNSFAWNDYKILLSQISQLFLDVESRYGGKEEGVVVNYLDGSGLLLKIQQAYQVDQSARADIKNKWRGTPEQEEQYWRNIRLTALEIIQHVQIGSRPLGDILKDTSAALKNTKISFEHPVKEKIHIQDDIAGNIKMIITKKLKGNNGALFIGKMRVLSNAHYKIIKDALNTYDNVVVALVTSADTKETKELRRKMLQTVFPKLVIVEANSGNIFTIINKSPVNINVILAGSDRVQGYEQQLKANPDMRVREIKRSDEDVSATKIIEAIHKNDFPVFKSMTPKEIWPFYEDLRKAYS